MPNHIDGVMRSILFVTSMDLMSSGSAQARQLALIEEMAGLGYDVTLFYLHSNPPSIKDCKILTLPQALGWLPWRFRLALFFAPLLLLRHRQDVLMCFDRDPQVMIPSVVVSKLFRSRVVHELTEFPSVVSSGGLYGRVSVAIFERFILPRLSGVMVISRALQDYVGARGATHVLLLPAIARGVLPWEGSLYVDGKGKEACFNFVYTGSLSEQKDGVLSLIEAFSVVRSRFPQCRLHLYGYGSGEQVSAIHQAIAQLGLVGAASLESVVPQEQVPSVLAEADALVLCRPNSLQAFGGFPTKLVEYLASGTPVITTTTSDIGRYLRNGVSAYTVPAGDVGLFAKRMGEVVGDPDAAARVGAEGRCVFERNFDASLCARRMADWLFPLNGQKG